MTTFKTLDDVVGGFAAWESEFRARGDRRCVFLTLYGVVSAEMRERVRQGAFVDPEWVHRYAVAFANLYARALEDYEARRLDRVPKAWRLCFDAAARGGGLVLTDLLLGVNAHVNHDLPYALDGVSIEPDRPRRYRDHAGVNEVLASVTERATRRLAELYAPGLTGLDAGAGEIDEMLSLFSLQVARESAWESATALANARTSIERDLAMTLIGTRAAVLARLLLAPTLSPTLVATCSHMEQGTGWVALVVGLRGGLAT
ncbi:MAG: DUF5995 family protein [Vicinamibacterales bacterium]